jgi:hypothetical protein
MPLKCDCEFCVDDPLDNVQGCPNEPEYGQTVCGECFDKTNAGKDGH